MSSAKKPCSFSWQDLLLNEGKTALKNYNEQFNWQHNFNDPLFCNHLCVFEHASNAVM